METIKEEKKSEYTVKDLLKDLEWLDENVCIAVIGKHCEREYVENMFLEKDLKSWKDTLIIFTDNSDEKEFEDIFTNNKQ